MKLAYCWNRGLLVQDSEDSRRPCRPPNKIVVNNEVLTGIAFVYVGGGYRPTTKIGFWEHVYHSE